MIEARAIPEMIAPPSPRQRGSARVMGRRPRIVDNLVRMIGSRRLAPASAIASIKGIF